MKQNYQRWLDRELERIESAAVKPKLLLHVCCAPCSSYVLEYLSRYFDITAHFYNPNIAPAAEYHQRAEELQRLLREMPAAQGVDCTIVPYDPSPFAVIAAGREHLPEGGERCTECYRIRLDEAAKTAKADGYDYFTTTLSISPLKDAERLNAIGAALSEQYGIPYLFSDFKKREGYKRSILLSADYNLYRQDYCGCIYSKRDAENRKKEHKE